MDAAAFAADRAGFVSAVWILLGLTGTLGQYLLERHRVKEKRERSADPENLIRKMLKP
jgi:hypothetical protein